MAKITQLVQTRFVPATDFQRTTRIAVGKAWSTATPEQQKQLYEQFTLLLMRTYAASLSQLRDQDVKFKFLPVNVPAGAKDVVVQSHVLSNGGDDAIDYRLTKGAAGWKIYDINMMGAWLIQVYQTQFADQISKGGIDGLIKFLTAHNARGAGNGRWPDVVCMRPETKKSAVAMATALFCYARHRGGAKPPRRTAQCAAVAVCTFLPLPARLNLFQLDLDVAGEDILGGTLLVQRDVLGERARTSSDRAG